MEIKTTEPISIKEYLKKVMTKEEYNLWIEPIIENTAISAIPEEKEINVLIVPNIYFKSRISEILRNHNIFAGILIQNQQELKVAEPQKAVETQQSLATRTLQMEKPYGKEKVATSDIINSKFFTYPTSQKTKYSITETTLNNEDYIVHRGKTSTNPNEEPIGQLNTNHLRILLAIIHIWQEQNCKFLEINTVIKLSLSMKEIAKKIGYNLGGKSIKWIQQKVKELTKYPITIEKRDNGKTTSFTFLNEVTTQTEPNKRNNKIILTMHQILSQQLYKREAILRPNTCYKIKNPTSLKFLLTYDKRIYAAQEPFKLSLEEIAEELELKGTKQSRIRAINKVIKNLDGYKISDKKQMKLELEKEGKEIYLMVDKREEVQSLPLAIIDSKAKLI
jgi:hypothetical protein